MKVVMLYRHGEAENQAKDYLEQFTRSYPDKPIEMLDVDSPEGQQKAELYDVSRYPALLATREDGSLQQLWQAESLPPAGELAYYLQA